MEGKDETYFKICHTLLRLEVEKGHLRWSASEISRISGVTRSLIYYYFGKEKEAILQEAYRFMLDLLLNIDNQNRSGNLYERIQNILEKLKQMPYLYVLFFLEKSRDGVVGEMIRDAEKKLLELLAQDFPDLSSLEILKIYLLELGAITYRDLSPKQVKEIFASEGP